MKKFEPMAIEEPPKSRLTQEEERLVQIKNERHRLEKEIDILKIRYDDRQRAFEIQERVYRDKTRVDQDQILKQLVDNKARAERLEKTQSEVNQMRAKIEAAAEEQKKLLLRKEVELTQKIQEAEKLKEEYAAKLGR